MPYIGKSPSVGVRNRFYFTASGGETSLSGADSGGRILTFSDGKYVDVMLNGVTLVAGTDYNTTTANTIAGLTALTASDIIEIVVYDVFSVPDAVSAVNGGTFQNNIDVTGTVTADGLTVDGTGTIRDDAATTSYYSTDVASNIVTHTSNGTGVFAQEVWKLNDGGTPSERMRLTTTGLGIGSNSPNVALQISLPSATLAIDDTTTSIPMLRFRDNGTTIGRVYFTGGDMRFDTNGTTEAMRIDSSGNVGIGVVPEAWNPAFPSVLQIGAGMALTTSGGDNARIFGNVYYDGSYKRITSGFAHQYEQTGGTHRWYYAATDAADSTISFSEAMRVDGGNLLIGTTSSTIYGGTTTGINLNPDGATSFNRASGQAAMFNRISTDGDIVQFRKDGSTVGTIGCNGTNTYIVFRTEANGDGTGLRGSGSQSGAVIPTDGNGDPRDDAVDMGGSSSRFDDIYATNGTIQTSDQNEKQQIAALTDAEITAAKAISTLFKTFKWNSAVTEKGDAARTHAGVIAQDVEAAMTAAGLDAGDYAFFISSTWWETQTEVPAVEAVEAVYEDVVIPAVLDEDGNEVEAERTEQRLVTEAVEAVAAYTRTDTYETAEEAPEGAVERTRLGIRYPELLAFVGAATEQRLANIETRLTALETA